MGMIATPAKGHMAPPPIVAVELPLQAARGSAAQCPSSSALPQRNCVGTWNLQSKANQLCILHIYV